MNKIKKIVQHLPTTWYNAFKKKIIMHHYIAMSLSLSLHTNKTLVLPPSPYTLLLNEKSQSDTVWHVSESFTQR